jgi:hypothetical protein
MCLIFLKKFDRSICLSLIIISILCIAGCLNSHPGESPEAYEGEIGELPSRMTQEEKLFATDESLEYLSYVEADFESVIGPTSFHTRGTVILRSGAPLAYLILNATLWDGEKLVEKTRYMIIGVQPDHEYSFHISENKCLDYKDSYICLLEIIGPNCLISSERRQCLIQRQYSKVPNENYDTSFPKATAEERYIVTSNEEPKFDAVVEMNEPEQEYNVELNEVFGVGQVDDPTDLTEEFQTAALLEESFSGEFPKDSLDAVESGAYVGSVTSDKYHETGCRYAAKIRPENEIWFTDAKEAQRNGYVPCKVCNPP